MNCRKVTFSGTITDLSNGQPLKNVDIKVYLFPDQSGGLFDVKSDILAANGRTNEDGAFSFSPVISNDNFTTYTTGINAYLPDGYLESPVSFGKEGYHNPLDYESYTFYHQYDSAAFRNLNFGFYENTLLLVHAHHTSPSVNRYVDIDYSLSNNPGSSGDEIIESEVNKDTTLSVMTAANVYTVITTSTYLSATATAFTKDSVRCTKNGPNAIDIYY